MNLAAIGTGIWGFLKRIPDWVLWALAAIIFLKFVDMRAEGRGRKDEREKIARKQAEVKAAVNERATEIISEERTNADEAIEARDNSPSFPASDVVPDQVGRVIFRD
jgi:hypothetical protein